MSDAEIKQKLDALSLAAKAWLRRAADQMNDGVEYIDNPKARAECVAAGVLTQMRGKRIEISAEVNHIVYSEGYLAAKF